jgi:hypothetical protein
LWTSATPDVRQHMLPLDAAIVAACLKANLEEVRETMNAKNHIKQFLDRFVRKPEHDRWKVLIDMGKYERLDIADFQFICDKRICKTISANSENLFLEKCKGYLNEEVLVVRGGHDSKPGVSCLFLKDFLKVNNNSLEGFVSIIPGQFVLVFDHEGYITVCDSRER